MNRVIPICVGLLMASAASDAVARGAIVGPRGGVGVRGAYGGTVIHGPGGGTIYRGGAHYAPGVAAGVVAGAAVGAAASAYTTPGYVYYPPPYYYPPY